MYHQFCKNLRLNGGRLLPLFLFQRHSRHRVSTPRDLSRPGRTLPRSCDPERTSNLIIFAVTPLESTLTRRHGGRVPVQLGYLLLSLCVPQPVPVPSNYPLRFRTLAHSLAPRPLCNSFGINSLCTLSVVTGVYGGPPLCRRISTPSVFSRVPGRSDALPLRRTSCRCALDLLPTIGSDMFPRWMAPRRPTGRS